MIKKRSIVQKYKNTILVLGIIFIVFIMLNNPATVLWLKSLGNFGFVGAFVAGVFFVSSFTVAIAGVGLFFMAETMNPIALSLVAGLGAVVGDYLIFRFIKDRVFEELKPLFLKIGGSKLHRILKFRHFRWLASILGAVVIASPFPDEIGIGLMGLSKIKNWQFIVLTFVLNSIGIYLLITATQLL